MSTFDRWSYKCKNKICPSICNNRLLNFFTKRFTYERYKINNILWLFFLQWWLFFFTHVRLFPFSRFVNTNWDATTSQPAVTSVSVSKNTSIWVSNTIHQLVSMVWTSTSFWAVQVNIKSYISHFTSTDFLSHIIRKIYGFFPTEIFSVKMRIINH